MIIKSALIFLCATAAFGYAHASPAGTIAKTPQYCRSAQYPENSAYRNSQKLKDLELKKFANTPIVAKQADQLLSALIVAKSPVIFSWIKKRHLNTNHPDAIVLHWRRYYAENFVLRVKPDGPAMTDKVADLFNKVYKAAFDKKTKAKFDRLFTEAKKYSLVATANLSIAPDVKKEIHDRISAIHLYWMKTFKGSRFENSPLDGLNWGVAYDPDTNEINMGVEALRYNDDDNIVAVFAHEIGHSIDPCRWHAVMTGDNPFSKVVSCLRSAESVGAKLRDDSKMAEMVKAGKLSKELEGALKANPTCNKLAYPPIGVQNDQIEESFADWFSAEVLGHDTKRISRDARADLCKSSDLIPGSSYPTNADRLNRIYLAQPIIRQKLNMPAKSNVRYCSM